MRQTKGEAQWTEVSLFSSRDCRKSLWCVWLFAPVYIMSPVSAALFFRPQNSLSFDVQAVNKKSKSTVLYSKGLYPSGLYALAALVYLSSSSSSVHSPELSTLNCFLVQKLLRCIRTCNGLCLGKGIRRPIDCAYWVQLEMLTPLNYSCFYHNYCPNCNNVWAANCKEGKRNLDCHFLPAL